MPTAPIVDVAAPEDLTPEELKVWTREAPLALRERTLTMATAGAFREMCELEALKNRMLTSIKLELTTTDEKGNERANPLLTHYRGAVQRLSTFRKDFKLAPFGKELLDAAPADTKREPQQKRAYW